MENLEDMELEQLDVPEGAEELSLPRVVWREIFQNLSNADLLNLSLVNKLWNYETRSVLRDRGAVTAKMFTADEKCKDLRAFASVLRRMREVRRVVPFSGLTIVIRGADDRHEDWCEESEAGELDEIYEDILHQMNWKHLALHLSRQPVRGENCAGFELVKKILNKRSGVLQEFSIDFVNVETDKLSIQSLTQDCNLSNLRRLTFNGNHCENLIKALVSRAPNLEVLSSWGPVNISANLLEGSSAEHVLKYPFDIGQIADVPESILGQLRLEFLYLQHLDLRRLGTMEILLRNSRTTLRTVRVGTAALVLLVRYGIRLENVRELGMVLTDAEVTQPHSKRRLKSFDFTHIFPNIRSVAIPEDGYIDDPDDVLVWNAVTRMVDQGNPAFIEPPDRTVNIKKLILAWSPSIPESSTRFLVEMFPHVEKLDVRTTLPSLFARFWDHWEELEELDFTLELFPGDVVGNLDSGICGIFPEEVAHLREEDDDYLRAVNIVPVMPSLCSFKRLRTFNIFFREFGGVVDPTSTISKVSGLIAFKRCPHLRVTLQANRDSLRQALQPMEPYATVQLIRQSFR